MILLTAAGTLGDRLAGLSDGADDYVVKPFEPRELLARIRAVLRRLEAKGGGAPEPAPARPALRMGGCTFDTEARCLRDPEGAEIALTAMEYDLLEVFSRHPRQVLSRSQLAELAHGRPLAPGRPLDRHPHHPPARQDRRGRPHPADAADRARRGLRLRPGR